MDSIELSNLNRQFLYQQGDIGKLKSAVLKDKLENYCPDLRIKDFGWEVGTSSEKVFNKTFLE